MVVPRLISSFFQIFASVLIIFFLQFNISSGQGFTWANQAGGNNSDAGEGIAKDAAGNIYITGFFGSGVSSFGSVSLTGTGIQNLFVAKYDHVTGNCIWAAKADGFIFSQGIFVASNGDIYLTGYLNGSNSFGSLTATATGIYDVFVAKLDSSGTWQWVTTAGGIGAGNQDYGNAVVADDAGNSYVIGTLGNTIYFGSTGLTSFGNDDIFIAKLNSAGVWQWAKQFGSTYIDDGNGIIIDPSGNLYCTGCFSGTVAFGSTTLTSYGASEDIFVCKLDSGGNISWAVKAGGSTPDYGNGLQRDASGNLFVTGWYSTTATFGSSAVTTLGGNEVFIARCDSVGNWQWAASGGTAGIDIAYDIVLDNEDNSYITGYVNAGYPVIFGSDTITIASDYSDIFLAKCDSSGSWQWLAVEGSVSWDVGYGIVTDNCSQYVTGYFTLGVNFDSILLTSSGVNSDAFIGKYTYDPSACQSFYASDPTLCEKFCIDFFDQSTTNPTSWQWLFPGGSPASSPDQNPTNICYNTPGTYDVTLITTSTSGNDTILLSDYITVYSTPPFPVINQNGYTLTSSSADFYQWQFNSVDIPGATNQSYDATQSGYYTVIITDQNGCSSSTVVYILISGVSQSYPETNISVYPNPSAGNVVVDFGNKEADERISIDVKNTAGQKVFSSQQKIRTTPSKVEIDLSDLNPGIYLIEIKSSHSFSKQQLVISR